MHKPSRQYFIIYLWAAAVLTILFSMVFSLRVMPSAHAVTFLEIESIVADELNTDNLLSSKVVSYTAKPYDIANLFYGRNVTINYEISGVSFVRVDTQVYDEPIVTGSTVSTSGLCSYSYKVDKNGRVGITCYAFDENMELLCSRTTEVLSDTIYPDTYASVTPIMNSYVGNVLYNVAINWTDFGDTLSGRGRVFFAYDYDDENITGIALSEVDVSTTEISTISINGKGTLTIFYFDKAGNCIIKTHEYKKFDILPPPVPSITITPNVNLSQSNGYAKQYEVSIEYTEDTESGLAQTQFYFINGEKKTYYGSFIVNHVTNYIIKAYALDKVGNSSAAAEATINYSTFDVDAPFVESMLLTIDLTKETIATLSIEAKDESSGVANAILDTFSKAFIKGTGNTYRVDFDPYNISSLVFRVADKVGNEALQYYILNYFENDIISARLKDYNDIYLALNRDIYNQKTLEQIEREYEALNIMLIASDTQEGQIYAKMDKIDKLIAGESEHTYEILSTPIVVSTILTYKITESDFENYKKGDSIKVVLSSAVGSDNYVKLAGYSKGFADYFSLKIFYEGEEINNLEKGIEVSMNLPIGYYERQYTLIDTDTKEILTTAIVNNQIVFHCKKNSTFALVISGNKEIALTNAPKYINLFGKKLTYGTFFGIVFGVIGGAALAITIVIVIRKKR